MKKQIEEANYNSDKLDIEIASLKEKSGHLSSEEGLRDVAIDLGYYVEGDVVYLFDDVSLQDDYQNYNLNFEDNSFKPISSSSVLLIDLCVSAVFSFFIWFLSKEKNKFEYEIDEGNGNLNDSDYYINA